VVVAGDAFGGRIKKGPAYHWDLMVVALLNAVLAYFGLPMVHGALPHSSPSDPADPRDPSVN